MMNVPKILESTKPLLYETGYDDWPYAYAGSCFPVRWKNQLYIVSAFHCFENHQVQPEATLYPIPMRQEDFFGYCCKLRGKAHGAKDSKHYDQILLQVSQSIHSNSEIDSVNALDLSEPESIISLSCPDVVDVWLRGFLSENSNHSVDYESGIIKQQAYVTNGLLSSRKSLFAHCYMLKVKTPVPAGVSPNGMSGSAVYAVDKRGTVKFAGTVIEYNQFTAEFLVIDSVVLSGLLRTENA